MEKRELFSSRLGFLLIAAGCAIGLGNVWRFPYIAGEFGGAVFVLVYVAFLLLVGVPLLTVELAVGRASRQSLGQSFERLTPRSGWRRHKYWMIAGNYVLMAFYSLVTGWMLYYTVEVFSGQPGKGIDERAAGEFFSGLLASPGAMFICALAVTVLAFSICAAGVRRGVERITKPMMLALFALMLFLAAHSFLLPGFSEGISYYLSPSLSSLSDGRGVLDAVSAAMGQAFFTLGLGVGSIQIFGSYMDRRHTLLSEALLITGLDTAVALLAGFIVFPACFSYGVEPGSGPGLVFVTLVSVFSNMESGFLWGGLFFLFMLCAAVSTLITVFENIIAICMELFGISRTKSVLLNFAAVVALGMPCLLGYNLLSWVHPLGGESTILDAYDFVLSNNILPLGALCYIAYVAMGRGWGFGAYLHEANTGEGLKIPAWAQRYYQVALPVVVILLFLQGYLTFFGN
ncbi:MAG: sodium-dependent transporter [Succinivibrionaceae bacterium]|nr:sodium-dependent transporter [Succinivibrionaceae bacterium]